jgi:hypothetical protein
MSDPEPSATMNLLTKIGIAICIAIIMAALGGFGFFYYNGPRVTLKRIDLLNESDRYNKVFVAAQPLLKILKEGDFIYPDDMRGSSITEALTPVPYSYVALVDGKLSIECGGGFYHFGYEVKKDAEGILSIAFKEEEKEPKKLKTTEPNQRLQTMRLISPFNSIAEGPHV